MREGWLGQSGAVAVAAPVGFGTRRPPFRLVVNLAEDVGSRTWWRGVATLFVLTGALTLTAPGIEPLPVAGPERQPRAIDREWRAAGSDAPAMRMMPTAAVEPIARAPERASVDLFLTLGRDGIAPALARVGTAHGDAVTAQNLVRAVAPDLRAGTSATVRLGRQDANGRRPLDRLELRAALDLRLVVERGAGGLVLNRVAVPVDTKPVRIRGVAGDGLYWALRSAGASSGTAADYLKAINGELDVGEIGSGDRFDLVVANRRSADGSAAPGALLYAGLTRGDGTRYQLVRWSAGGKPVWVNAATLGDGQATTGAMQWPVAARITSGFGYRIHPILRFARLHRGIDFGASWGTPIHASADGTVTKAGWAGGYGRQVRIAHGDGLMTSYSHMSSFAVEPGTMVRQGQVIGYVGSSGLSTGPHLHYEVHRDGTAVNPMRVRFATVRAADPEVIAAIRARVKALTGGRGS